MNELCKRIDAEFYDVDLSVHDSPTKGTVAVVYFYENPLVSEVLKGHNNVIKEIVKSDSGEKFVFQRQKRVLKVSLAELLTLAQREIG